MRRKTAQSVPPTPDDRVEPANQDTSSPLDGRAATESDPAGKRSDTLSCDQRVLQAIRQLIRAVDIHSRKLVAEYHITGPQLVCLLEIAESGPLTATAIARAVHLSASTVVGILDRLEAKGLVLRERDHKDRRMVYVTITQSGRHLIDRAPSPLHESISLALGQLPPAEREVLADALSRVARFAVTTTQNAAATDEGPTRALKSRPERR